MSIKDFSEKIKDFGRNSLPHPGTLSDDLFLGLIMVLVAIGAFGLGRLSKIESSRTPVRIENEPTVHENTFGSKAQVQNGQTASIVGAAETSTNVVASKSGTKYYYPWCSGVQKIVPANLITFSSKEQAESAGYTPSSTCKGL